MSDYQGSRFRDRRGLRRAVVLLSVLLGLALVAVGGSLLGAESASPAPAPSAVVGRTATVCTVPSAGGSSASPAPSTDPTADPTDEPSGTEATVPPSAVSAVAVRQSVAGGRLSGAPLGATGTAEPGELDVTEQGTGASLPSVTSPLVLTGEGAMATAVSGVVTSTATSGESTGLMAAPCLLPGTEQWFVGVGSSESDRTELILVNPDDAQAEVDLRFYGASGRVVVPGSPGVVVGARETRTVSVDSLIDAPGPVAVAVRASSGRVSVAARRIRTDDLKPAGADWQVPSAGPGTSLVVPGVPGGAGSRLLELVNPGTETATVGVEVLGLGGPFAPAGADAVQVPPESTATVELTAGLAQEAGSVRLRSDRPVSAAVVSTSTRDGAVPDLAVQSAEPALVRQGVAAVATTTGSTASELVLSNAADTDAPVSFELLSYAGVSLRRDEILLGAGTTATRRLTSPEPSYVVITVPDGSTVVGSVTLTLPDADVAGLATIALLSPDVAGRAPRVEQDPAVGR